MSSTTFAGYRSTGELNRSETPCRPFLGLSRYIPSRFLAVGDKMLVRKPLWARPATILLAGILITNVTAFGVTDSSVLTRWLPFRRQIQIQKPGRLQHQNFVIGLADTPRADNSVMENLQDVELDFEPNGLKLEALHNDNSANYSHQARPHSCRKTSSLVYNSSTRAAN